MAEESNIEDQQIRVSEVIKKIKSCPDFNSLYCLEKKFNNVGMTIKSTAKDNMILCKIVDGKPYAEEIIDDFIFIGCLENKNDPLNDRLIDCLIDFVINNASAPAKIKSDRPKWKHDSNMYGKINLVHEEVQKISQAIID